ncbi:MAG: GH36-type glycosyl hydrolase domain-containing protein, partial [Pyrinomonadaceae bacterium]
PLLVAWALTPLVAHRVSLRLTAEREALLAPDTLAARLVARRTWRFFETFVGAEDNWLPPDNYQEDPHSVIAHRTSPTNIGLLLLSTAAARDLGYTATLEMTERLELTFATLEKLPRFRGHYLNWYDTRTLEPLNPQYVSTVDSGNLAGHLLAVKQACVEIADAPLFDARCLQGVADTLALMRDEAAQLASIRQRTQAVTIKQLRGEIDAALKLVTLKDDGAAPATLGEWSKILGSLAERAEVIEDIVGALAQEHGAAEFEELRFWVGALLHQTRARRRDLQTLTPWAEALTAHLTPVVGQCSEEAARLWGRITEPLERIPAASRVAEQCDAALVELAALRDVLEQSPPTPNRAAALNGLTVLTNAIEEASGAAQALLSRLARLARDCERAFDAMDFKFLFDAQRKVFAIGYNVTDGRQDDSFYDLLASESRLASFVAIAKGDAPQEHWFRLGRQLTPVDGGRALIS